ncbi:MAG: hypothetical protein JW751_10325 [Polyangiaceae bacterium]|nr:hypothetical protein [Polyangiaceae bacterium]
MKRYPPGTPIATYPGFRLLPGGRSLVWLVVTRTVAVREERAEGRVTYFLEGARVEVANNTNALITTHFVTPLARVQIVPTETGTSLIIELREVVELEHSVAAGPHGSMVLMVEVPPSAMASHPQPSLPPPTEGSMDDAGYQAEPKGDSKGSGRASAKASASASFELGGGQKKRRKKRR